MKSLTSHLQKPVDISPLVVFRILGGLLMTIELTGGVFTSYFEHLSHDGFHFSFVLTPWLKPWENTMMLYLHFGVNAVLGMMVVLGWRYRFATLALAISGASIFLMEKALYINHIYLYCLYFFLLFFLPANRSFSLDVKLNSSLTRSKTPAWTIYIVIFQILLVYFFAGIAKINADWLQAQPIKMWLYARDNHFLLGKLFSRSWYAYLVAYGGLFFDLLVTPFLLWKQTRKVTFVLAIVFHALNAITFGIGTFPWLSILVTSMIFGGSFYRKWRFIDRNIPSDKAAFFYPKKIKNVIVPILSLYIILQLLIPLRGFLYPGNASWTEEGHNFAWHMMLRSKRGTVTYYVDKGGETLHISPSLYLTRKQYYRMIGKPDMILEMAYFLQKKYGHPADTVQVRARCTTALNARPSQLMIDTTVILTEQKRGLHHYDWVIPLKGD